MKATRPFSGTFNFLTGHLRTLKVSRRTIFVIAAVLILLVGWWSCSHGSSSNSSRDNAASASSERRGSGPAGGGPVPVVAGKSEQKDVPIYLDGLGTVQAFNTVTVHTRVDGQLDKVLFVEGQDVKAGDLLAVIDPRPFQAALDQAVAKKAQDEAQLANAKVTLQRNTDLLNKKVIDQQDFDTSKYLGDQFVAAVQADQAAIEAAKTQLDYTQIKSPIDGRTGVRLVDGGNIVHAADPTGIVVITQMHPISVVFTLPEQNLQPILNSGGADGGLHVSALDRGNTTALDEGSLAVVDNQIDQATGTVRLKATFPNEQLKLWPGKFVNARLILTTRKDAIVVPASVVQRGPQGTYAYVIKPDKSVEMRAIKVGQVEANLALIEEGLKAGEQVVVDGQYKLQPGAHVEVAAPQPQPSPDPARLAES
ncbi:MAG TPA: efflux RND transporter periplasmic adaptor subunit [Chthoniobacterales bacterium]|nr:efflux RND transporter periplasmic adaptor subunit [Chthoniobacterales bacterium]